MNLHRTSRAYTWWLLFAVSILGACTGEIDAPPNSGSGAAHTTGGSDRPPPQGGAGSSVTTGTSGGAAGSGGGAAITAGTGGAPATAGMGGSLNGSSGAGGLSGGAAQTSVFSRVGLAARLSKFEYQNSIADVLGVALVAAELDAATGGIPDDAGDGVFKHAADKQTSVEQHALAYFQVAGTVAARVTIDTLSSRLGTCTEKSTQCATAFVRGVGRLLFRRPLEQREVDALLTVYDAAVTEKLSFADSARCLLRGMLQMPQFLFRMSQETLGAPNQPRDLNGYELAEQLASFLWISVPDDALLVAAADDSLVEPAVFSAQIQRMLADKKAQRFTEVFATDFSRARFASFEGSTDADRQALNESIVATFQDHFWTQRRGITELFTTTRFIVNPTVAKLLGLSMTGSGLQVVDVSALPQRVGVLSHPGMIAGIGDRAIGSFVGRGKYLMERLLCRNPLDVPAALGAEIETFTATTTGLNEPERSTLRQMRPVCWGCHKQFEPFSFGFSRFDGAGRYVGETDPDGKPLPMTGWVPTAEAQEPTYTDLPSYMQVLATNPVIQTCMTEHFIAFATARSPDELARAQASTVGKEYRDNGGTLAAMVGAVAKSPLFRTILPASSTQSGSQP